jgi:hypothetical protein
MIHQGVVKRLQTTFQPPRGLPLLGDRSVDPGILTNLDYYEVIVYLSVVAWLAMDEAKLPL